MLFKKYNIWENCKSLHDLYAKRAQNKAPEMDCAAQCAEILAEHYQPRMSLLDAGCGSGWYYWSFKKRDIEIEYYGLDSSETIINIAKKYMPSAGLSKDRFELVEIENIDSKYDIVICFNVLLYMPNYHYPLERLCVATKENLLIRTTLGEREKYRYEIDPSLDSGSLQRYNYYNIYPVDELIEFIKQRGFQVELIRDRHVGDGFYMGDGLPHPWQIVLAKRIK